MTHTRPIIFSAPMIRALLDGRKTMTRRVPRLSSRWRERGYTHLDPTVFDDGTLWWWDGVNDCVGASQDPPYRRGDLLWVREAWADVMSDPPEAVYRADGERPWSALPWRSPIHMPRWASRLTLEVTGVKVERLQDISEEDALAEGIAVRHGNDPARYGGVDGCRHSNPVDAFSALWDSLNAKRGYGWDTNPWICALRFDVHQRNVDDLLAEKAA